MKFPLIPQMMMMVLRVMRKMCRKGEIASGSARLVMFVWFSDRKTISSYFLPGAQQNHFLDLIG